MAADFGLDIHHYSLSTFVFLDSAAAAAVVVLEAAVAIVPLCVTKMDKNELSVHVPVQIISKQGAWAQWFVTYTYTDSASARPISFSANSGSSRH
jgi:hypothetical protein